MIGLYLLGAVLLVLLVAAVLGAIREEPATETELDGLPPEERYDAALEALEEVEFDYRTGKLPEDDYRRLRARYGRAALEAREALGDDGAPGGGRGGEPAGARPDSGAREDGEARATPRTAGGDEAGEPEESEGSQEVK